MQSIWPLWKKSVEHFTTSAGKLWFLASLNTWQRGVRILFKNYWWLGLLGVCVLISTLETYGVIKTASGNFSLIRLHASTIFIQALCSSILFIIKGLLLFFVLAAIRPSIEPKTQHYFLKYLTIICTSPVLFVYWIAFSFYGSLHSPLLGLVSLVFLFFLLDAPPEKGVFRMVLGRTWKAVKYTFPMIFVLSLLSLILEMIAGLGSIFMVVGGHFSFLFIVTVQLLSTLFLYVFCIPIVVSLVVCWLVKFKHEHPNLLLS